MELSARAAQIAEQIKQQTQTQHLRLTLNEQRAADITSSKIGGLPYWNPAEPYPVDSNGAKMILLAQINFAEAPQLSPLPQQGMLQWFISVNDKLMYGLQGNTSANQADFRIVFHPAIDRTITAEAVAALGLPTHATVDKRLSPVAKEAAIDMSIEQTYMGVNDGRFKKIFNGVVRDITGVDRAEEEWYGYMDNADNLWFEQNLGMSAPTHQVLGYPVFTQDDPRSDIARYDTLLFELASQFGDDGKELVMWGDMGAGFLFINGEALQRQDFTDVLCAWDCG